jgi:molybdopterin molybdotransferase
MAELLPVEDAIARVLDGAAPLPTERVALADACGRVLATDLAARRTQPPAAVSAMDGYAVVGADVAAANARLKVVGEVAAGHPFSRSLAAGEAARIFTGGVLPDGADTVVVQECASRTGDIVSFDVATPTGKNVRLEGLDFRTGEVLLRQGRRLTVRDLALAAAMNHAELPVARRPKVALLATGDELVPPGAVPGPGQIIHSNGFALAALARAEGALTVDLGITKDRLDDTIAAVRRARALGADVLVTSGGASVGDHDLVRPALAAEGLDLSFWKVALRPGKPLMHGRLGSLHVIGLPGNPVSSFMGAFLFLAPLLRALQGCHDVGHLREQAVLGCDLKANDERVDYLRGTLSRSDGTTIATPFPNQDSSMITPLAQADCLIFRPPFAAAAPAGSPCTVIKINF